MRNPLLLIHIEQLDVLGFHQPYRLLFTLLLTIIFIYFIFKFIVTALVRLQYITLLTYFLVSLVIISGSLILEFIYAKNEMFSLGLQAIAYFGFSLLIYKIYERLKQFVKQKLLSSNKRYI